MPLLGTAISIYDIGGQDPFPSLIHMYCSDDDHLRFQPIPSPIVWKPPLEAVPYPFGRV